MGLVPLVPEVLVPQRVVVIVYHKLPPVRQGLLHVLLPEEELLGAHVPQHPLPGLAGVVDVVAVVVQLRHHVAGQQRRVEADVGPAVQGVARRPQGREPGVQVPPAEAAVPGEDAVGGEENLELRLRVVLEPVLHHRQILQGKLQIGVFRRPLLRNRGTVIGPQGLVPPPPGGFVPGEALVQGLPAALAGGYKGVEAVVKGVLVQKILHVVQGIPVIEVLRHGVRHAAAVPDQGV